MFDPAQASWSRRRSRFENTRRKAIREARTGRALQSGPESGRNPREESADSHRLACDKSVPRERSTMSEQDITTSEPKDEDVEAHKKKSVQANEEPKAEGESDD